MKRIFAVAISAFALQACANTAPMPLPNDRIVSEWPVTSQDPIDLCLNVAGSAKAAAYARSTGRPLSDLLFYVNTQGDPLYRQPLSTLIERVYNEPAMTPEATYVVEFDRCIDTSTRRT